MYAPHAFVDDNPATLDALVAEDPFVTLVTVDGDGLPQATHLPVLYRRDGDRVLIEGHWSRANPQARHAGAALVIVHGPHAYVSPGWYPDREQRARVPTWNYVAAHLYGTLERFEDETALADLVMRLSERFERDVDGDWAFEPAREGHRVQLRGIVGFRFVAHRIQVQSKLSQNHPEANRRSVAAALQARPDTGAHAIAARMRARES